MGRQILTTGDAAKRLNISGEYVRKLTREGKLSAMRTAGGQYLFNASEVERLRIEREVKRQQKDDTCITANDNL